MKFLPIILGLLAASSTVAQDAKSDAYLCIADMATGFKYENGKWQQTKFNVDDGKYILRHPTESDSSWVKEHKWAWAEFGKERAYHWCDKPEDSDYFECTGTLEEVLLNIKSLRFQIYYQGTYLSAHEEKITDTPYIEIGKCSPL